MDKFLDLFLKPALVGTISAVGAAYIFGESSQTFTFPIVGPVNSLLGIGVITGGASLVSSFSKDFILPYIPNNNYVDLEVKLITPVVNGALTTLALYSSLQSNQVILNSFLLGSVSEIAGDYTYEAVKPYILR